MARKGKKMGNGKKTDFKPGWKIMGDKGRRDKGRREEQKKAKQTPKEKRKEKKQNSSPETILGRGPSDG